MKIVKIFGIVVAVHAAAFMFVFAIPGCRSTSHRAPSPAETSVGSDEEKRYYPGVTGYSTTTPSEAADSGTMTSADLNPGVSSAPLDFGVSSSPPPASGGSRFNPTRPNTPVASALQTSPSADVQPIETYTVKSGDSLWSIARKHGISDKELAAANNFQIGSVLPVGKKLIIPAKVSAAKSSQGAGIEGDVTIYEVKSGDTLGAIARRHGTTVAAIRALNKLKGDSIAVNQKLTIPANPEAGTPFASSSSTPRPTARPGASDLEYTVQPNDSLESIASRHGVTARSIGAANNLANPNLLRAGQKLIIPGAANRPVARPAGQTPAPAVREPQPQPQPGTPIQEPVPASPISPVSPISPISPSPISAPSSDQPPVVPVEGPSPISPGN